jgi:very-short-patch-repair endonuclease
MKSILETHPEIAKQWHPTKNEELKPENFSFGSGQKVWWLCNKTCPEGCLHEWESNISSRCGYMKSGCPYCCENSRILCKHVSIVYTHPEIVKQWHPTKNEELKPKDFTFGSGQRVWWVCKYDHSWDATIIKRCRDNRGCPYCKNKTEEKLRIYLDCKSLNPISQFKNTWCIYPETNNYFRFDFLIEKFNLIIELDGEQHFKQVSNWKSPELNQEKDIYKMKKALENLYSIIRIKQQEVWDNDYSWLEEKLLPHIKNYEIPCVLYIEENKDYEKYKNLMIN